VREPWRVALAYLFDTFGEQSPDLLTGIPHERLQPVRRMISTGFNTVQTSSCGRLFDAVAAIIGLRGENTFEAQAAIELESICDPLEAARYGFSIEPGEPMQLDFRQAIAEIATDVVNGNPPPSIAARFHNTVSAAVVDTCRRIRARVGLNRVCLSGGTFQNMRLLASTTTGLREAGFDVFLHAKVPPNDGGIALGQAVIAAATIHHAG
jgi:hydrogenase maturation protein HypF